MYCFNCGNRLNAEDKFCNNCGAKAQHDIDTQPQAPNQQIDRPDQTVHTFSNDNPDTQDNQTFTIFNPAGNPAAANKINNRRKKALLIVGIVVLSVILWTVFIAFSMHIVKGITDHLETKNELVLHDLKVEYPANWIKTSTDSDAIILDKISGKGRIAVTYFTSNFYYNSTSALNAFINEYEESWDQFETIGTMQDVTLNDTRWKKIEFCGIVNGENRRCMQMVHATDYDVYSLLYLSTEKNFSKYLDEANEIFDSAYLPPKEINTDAIKQKILGEWDCGDTGYLVINDDNTYCFYKDSSKDAGNVVYGTYEASDGIATNAAGYAEGITFIATLQKVMVDGQEQEIAEDAKIAYAFAPDETGHYVGRNLNEGSIFKMTKIK